MRVGQESGDGLGLVEIVEEVFERLQRFASGDAQAGLPPRGQSQKIGKAAVVVQVAECLMKEGSTVLSNRWCLLEPKFKVEQMAYCAL